MILYSREGCINCEKLIDTLNRRKINYTISEDMDKIKEAGFKQIPVLEFNGKMYNFDQAMYMLSNVNGKELMSNSKFFEGYSRYDEEENKYEDWYLAVERVINMHKEKYKHIESKELDVLMDEVEKGYKDKLFLGAQRALQFGGEQLFKHNSRLYNCAASYLNRAEFFRGYMYLLLSGAGVGFSIQKHHIDMLPNIKKLSEEMISYTIPDSIEGWSLAIDYLMHSYFDLPNDGSEYDKFRGKRIVFDFSEIRPKGSFISGGFKAPGPEPLRAAIIKIQETLDKEVKVTKKLRTIVAYDICMHMAQAVIAGGIRRSATVCMFSKDDEDMLNAKTGNWFIDNPQRSMSNNSVILKRDEITKKEFMQIAKNSKEFGEPGFIFVDSLETALNPCVTDDTMVLTTEGRKPVKDLIGKKFTAIVDGKEYDSISEGFWHTGYKDVFKLKTDAGFEVRATNNHKILTVDGEEEIWKELKDIKLGDYVKLNNNNIDFKIDKSEFNKGWALGNLVGDGTIGDKSALLRFWDIEEELNNIAKNILNDEFKTYKEFSGNKNSEGRTTFESSELKRYAEAFNIVKGDKTPSPKIESATNSTIAGYIRGFFDADGSVQGNLKKGVSLRLSQSNLERLEQVQRMLIGLGISSKIYKNRREEGMRMLPDGNGGQKEYLCKENHELIISKDNIIKFNDLIGFYSKAKSEKLSKIISSFKRKPYSDKFKTKVVSIVADGTEDVYDVTIAEVHRFDANGIIVHNCVEVGMYPTWENEDGTKEYGFQTCNLTEINGAKSTNKEIFFEQCKLASIMGTLQAGYTDFSFINDKTKEIIEKESLIGVGITGMMNNPEILFDPEIQKEGARIVKKWNKITADIIGIKHASRTTVIKPSGNASVLLGCASGIHGEHSERYFRHAQFNKDTEVAKLFMQINPEMCEQSVWKKEDIVVAFPIITGKNSKFKKDLLGVKQLDYVKLTQNNWIEEGTDWDLTKERAFAGLTHNVSNTISVDNWEKVWEYIYNNKESLCGVSLLDGMNGDKDYPQAPFTEVLTYEEIVEKYGEVALYTSALIEVGEEAFDNNLWNAINTAKGFGETLTDSHSDLLKRDFVRRFKKFSSNFRDENECGNCLKDVYLLHKWWKVNKNIKNINWAEDLGKKEFTDVDTLVGQACSGGQCEI